MDPISISLAAATFISLTKDLVDISKEVTRFCKDVRQAPQILDNFSAELNLLAKLLQQLSSDTALATSNDELLQAAIDQLSRKIQDLKLPIQQLQQKLVKKTTTRIAIALEHNKLRSLLQDVEHTKTSAMFAYQLLSNPLLRQGIDVLAQQNNKLIELNTQQALAHQTESAMLVNHGSNAARSSSLSWNRIEYLRRQHQSQTERTSIKASVVLQMSSYLWKLCVTAAYGEWTHPLHCSRTIPETLAGKLLATSIDTRQALELFASGAIHPLDRVSYHSDYHVSLLQYVISRTFERYELCALLLDISNLADDVDIITSALDYINVMEIGDGTRLSKMLIERSDIDIVLSWMFTDGNKSSSSDSDYWVQWMINLDVLDFIYHRQLHIVHGGRLNVSSRFLLVDPVYGIWNSLPAFLTAHGVLWAPTMFDAILQPAKDWLLHAFLYFCQRGFSRCGWDKNMISLAIQNGASAFSVVHGRSCLQTLGYASKLRGMTVARGQGHLFSQWVQVLEQADIDIKAYFRHESAFLYTHVSQSQHCLGHELRLDSVNTNGEVPSMIFKLVWSWSMWKQVQTPGSWPNLDNVPSQICWAPSDEEQTQGEWQMIIDGPSIESIAALDDVQTLLGWMAHSQTDLVQDDHGFVARSLLKPQLTRQRRSHSQPRSLNGVTWKLIPDGRRRWLDRCHICPFHHDRRLHWLGGQCKNASFDQELIACLRGTLLPHTGIEDWADRMFSNHQCTAHARGRGVPTS